MMNPRSTTVERGFIIPAAVVSIHGARARRRHLPRQLGRTLREMDEVGAVAVGVLSTRAARERDDVRPGERSRVRRVAQQHAEAGDGAGELHRYRWLRA